MGGNLLVSYGPPSTGFGVSTTGILLLNSFKTRTGTPAIFGGLYYDIFPSLTLSAETRYQWDMISQRQWFPGPPTAKLSATYTSFSPRVTVDYKYTSNSDVYALWSRGYKPGGFNTGLLAETPFTLAQFATLGATLAYQQERLDNYEAGLKSTWLDGRARTTLALFTDKWTNGQVSNDLFVNNQTGIIHDLHVVTNVGEVSLKGVEFEGDIAVTQHFTLSTSLDYTKSKILSFVYIPDGLQIRNSTNVNGNQLAQVPAWTWSISPSYTDHLSGEWDWFARIDYTHRGKYFVDDTNVAWLAPLDLVAAHIGVNNQSLKIEGYVTNLTNNQNLTEAIGGGCCHDILYSPATLSEIRVGLPDKRTFGIKATYDF